MVYSVSLLGMKKGRKIRHYIYVPTELSEIMKLKKGERLYLDFDGKKLIVVRDPKLLLKEEKNEKKSEIEDGDFCKRVINGFKILESLLGIIAQKSDTAKKIFIAWAQRNRTIWEELSKLSKEIKERGL